jgi:hypothetical protein
MQRSGSSDFGLAFGCDLTPRNTRNRAVVERLGSIEESTRRRRVHRRARYLGNVVYSVVTSGWGRTTALPSNRPARRSASASSARSSS